jgi:hypothetical protein
LDFRFRFVLSQEKKSFFVDYEGVKKYISLPATSNVFCFNNAVIKHGATYDETNNKILGVVRGKITNQEKAKNTLLNKFGIKVEDNIELKGIIEVKFIPFDNK